jgi:hypothetical protein
MRQHDSRVEDEIRQTEHRRMKTLVARDLVAARELIAEEFQLIPPQGISLTRDAYLGMIAAGDLRYSVWEAVSPIDVRLYGDVALIRYRAHIEVEARGRKSDGLYWFTDAYENRGGRWQIVWSQGTAAAAV